MINTKINKSLEEYERDIKKMQEEHLKNVYGRYGAFAPCLHDSCGECHGTGVKINGGVCIHHIACGCPKCTPHF